MVMEIAISVILLFVGIAVLVVIHICIVGRTFNGGSDIQGVGMVVQRRSIGMKRMSIEELNMLPCFDYMAGEKGSTASPVECAVCLENIKTGEKCRLLPNCGHSFHAQCIDSWLLKTPVCPVCRSCVNVSVGGEASVAVILILAFHYLNSDNIRGKGFLALPLFYVLPKRTRCWFFANRHVVVGRNSQSFLLLCFWKICMLCTFVIGFQSPLYFATHPAGH
ncbi:E3 ubiquitin-protein ligase ATL23 [Rosa sericea]